MNDNKNNKTQQAIKININRSDSFAASSTCHSLHQPFLFHVLPHHVLLQMCFFSGLKTALIAFDCFFCSNFYPSITASVSSLLPQIVLCRDDEGEDDDNGDDEGEDDEGED